MRAGKLDRRITLQAFADDGDGDPTTGQWQDIATVWAEQMDVNSAERFVDGQTLSEIDRTYRIRYRTDIDPTWRVKDELDALWTLEGVQEGAGRREETILVCSRFAPNERVYQ